MSIDELDLDVRSYNVLVAVGIKTAEAAGALTLKQLLSLKNCGRQSALYIRMALADADIPINGIDYNVCLQCGLPQQTIS